MGSAAVAHLIIDGVIWEERATDFNLKREQCLDLEAVADNRLLLIEQKRST